MNEFGFSQFCFEWLRLRQLDANSSLKYPRAAPAE